MAGASCFSGGLSPTVVASTFVHRPVDLIGAKKLLPLRTKE